MLGVPESEELPGCYGESGRSLRWSALTAFLSDSGDGGPVTLTGWTVHDAATEQNIVLPYKTAIGDTVHEVLATVPGSIGQVSDEGPYTGTFVIRTAEAPGLIWLSPKRDGNVVEASFEAEECD